MSQITHFCVTLSVFNYMGSFENEILSKGWKSLDKDASQGLHGKSLGSLQFGFTPLMKPSFITFNCNILSCYGLGKLNLMGRLTKFQVMLALLTFLCCQWQAFYHNVYFLVLDEWVKKIANVFKLSPFNFFCINAFLLCIKIQKKNCVAFSFSECCPCVSLGAATCGSPVLYGFFWLQRFLWMAHQVWFIKSFISFERWGLLHFSPINRSMLPKECYKTCRIKPRDGTDFQRLALLKP